MKRVLERPSRADCEAHCLSNGSSAASSFSNVILKRCLIWTEDDLRGDGVDDAQGFYLRVSISKSGVTGQTVVWVANREKPITDSFPVMSVTSHGELVILVNNNTVLWSSNSYTTNATTFEAAGSRGTLLDNGNVVLRNNNVTQTWQSFDYPTDTILPGMKVRLNLKIRKTTLFTSWKDDNNPAAGEFSFGIDPNMSWPASQLVIWKLDSTPFWRSGIWSGIKYSGLNMHEINILYNLGDNEEELYITLTNSKPNLVSRVIVDKSERFVPLSWFSTSHEWQRRTLAPLANYDGYGRCGPSRSCYDDKGSSRCRCLEGYESVRDIFKSTHISQEDESKQPDKDS